MQNLQTPQEIKERNYKLIDEFIQELENDGLSKKTIKTHLNNIDLFLNYFLIYYHENCEDEFANAEWGVMELDKYFGNWYIKKYLMSSVSNMKSSIASIKKFYKFMVKKGLIDEIDYKSMLYDIKISKDEWFRKMKMYEEDYPFEEIWDIDEW